GIRFPQHEIAGVGANVLRENSRQPMGGEILGGYEVQGGGYFEPREPADIGDLAQAAVRQHAADETRGALVARHILAAMGASRGMQPLRHDNAKDAAPGSPGAIAAGGRAAASAHLAGGGQEAAARRSAPVPARAAKPGSGAPGADAAPLQRGRRIDPAAAARLAGLSPGTAPSAISPALGADQRG
ncbi:MAG: hypothetical protein ACRD17_14630, partial [Terriglobales bacterium]